MTNYNYDALEKRLRDGAAPLNDPDLNDEAADAIRDLRAERDAEKLKRQQVAYERDCILEDYAAAQAKLATLKQEQP